MTSSIHWIENKIKSRIVNSFWKFASKKTTALLLKFQSEDSIELCDDFALEEELLEQGTNDFGQGSIDLTSTPVIPTSWSPVLKSFAHNHTWMIGFSLTSSLKESSANIKSIVLTRGGGQVIAIRHLSEKSFSPQGDLLPILFKNVNLNDNQKLAIVLVTDDGLLLKHEIECVMTSAEQNFNNLPVIPLNQVTVGVDKFSRPDHTQQVRLIRGYDSIACLLNYFEESEMPTKYVITDLIGRIVSSETRMIYDLLPLGSVAVYSLSSSGNCYYRKVVHFS